MICKTPGTAGGLYVYVGVEAAPEYIFNGRFDIRLMRFYFFSALVSNNRSALNKTSITTIMAATA